MHYNHTNDLKTQAIRKGIEISLETELCTRLCEQRKLKRSLLGEFDGERREVRKRLKKFKARRKVLDDGGALTLSQDLEAEEESQESLLGEIVEVEGMINNTRERLATTKRNLDNFS